MENLDQHLAVGSRVDRYRIEKVLGIGGFGVTYLATDTQLDFPVAIKEFMPDDCAIRSQFNSQILAKTNRQEDYQYGLDRFLDEAKTLAKFQHPNIVRVTNFVEANNTAYMVMEYYQGEALDDYLKRINFKGQMPESEILAIAKPILAGLEQVHAQGLLHRDIKPGNMYLRQNGEAMLIDFGAARYALGGQSKSISAIISLGYAPPEQYSSRGKQGPFSDLYALGSTLYQLIAGKAPVESTLRREAVQEEEPDPLVPAQQLGQGKYSVELLAAIDWCLQLTTKHRPQSAAEVLKALAEGMPASDTTASGTRRVKEGEHFGKKTKPSSHQNSSDKPQKLAAVWVPLVMASLVALAGGGYWWSQPSDEPVGLTDSPTQTDPAKAELLAVTLRANVAAAQIYIDGQGYYQPGQKLLPGSYQLVAAAEGYTSLRQLIEVTPGNTFFLLQLEKLPAALYPLTIVVSPADAAIQVLNIGPTYQRGMELPAGEYQIKASKTGYTSKTINANLSEQQQSFKIQLEQGLAALFIETHPSNTKIRFIGDDLSYTAGMKLAARRYRIEISKAGYGSKTVLVNLSQKKQRFRIELNKNEPSYRAGETIQDTLSQGGKGPELVELPKGSFQMGCVSGQSCQYDEKPVHTVKISHNIAMMKYEVTFSDYDKFSDATGRSRIEDEGWGRGRRPVISVSWHDAVAYSKWLSEQTGKIYRLASEAEWEYAARAGSQTQYSWGNSIDCSKARFGYLSGECGKQKLTDVAGSFSANDFGLYDMHGNVSEWVADCWHRSYGGAPSNGKLWPSDNCGQRAIRGGAWVFSSSDLRAATRSKYPPGGGFNSLGFRLVQDLSP